MLNLAIHHNIHLTREQRYTLHEKQSFTVTGVCVAVWYVGKKSSEPAREVFCNYHLSNPQEELPIQILEDGFGICLPYRPAKKISISDNEWRTLNLENPELLTAMYRRIKPEISTLNLLDYKDGGTKHLSYREHNKLLKNKILVNIMHYVNMNDIEELSQTMSMAP